VYYGRDIPKIKEWGGRLPVALVFPERLQHGLSTLGWQTVYQLLGSQEELAVERFFWDPTSPRPRSFDSDRDLGLFPLILFSLNFEGDFLTTLTLLRGADIPIAARHRPTWPIVLAGGPITFLNPFPILPALDGIFVGEAEAGLDLVIKKIAVAWIHGQEKKQVMQDLAALPGLLIPEHSKQVVQRQVHVDQTTGLVSPAYSCFVSSQAQFRDMFLLEINRGCPYGCRFCAAGSIYKPPRQAQMQTLQDIVLQCAPHKVGLVGTALTDWPDLLPFLQWLHQRKMKFSLSSLRADGLTEELLGFLRHTGTRTLTLALEGASTRLRLAMNKNFSEEAFLQAVERISRLQFNSLKLYMIIGWPDENEDDWRELDLFLEQVDAARKRGQGQRKKGVDLISLSVSCLIPKAWTAMQWAGIRDEKWLKMAMKRIKSSLARFKGMRFSGENTAQARVQAFLAKGGEEIFPCLVRAMDVGMPKALQENAALVDRIVAEQTNATEVFPWDRLDLGISKKYLYSEWTKYRHGLLTPPCPDTGCGACQLCGMDDFLQTRQ
jgi:radical SAM superfamily enzyme YgiQ (UPF0313 family)